MTACPEFLTSRASALHAFMLLIFLFYFNFSHTTWVADNITSTQCHVTLVCSRLSYGTQLYNKKNHYLHWSPLQNIQFPLFHRYSVQWFRLGSRGHCPSVSLFLSACSFLFCIVPFASGFISCVPLGHSPSSRSVVPFMVLLSPVVLNFAQISPFILC